MPFRLGREFLDQKDDDQAADDRRKENPVAEAARPFENVGVVTEAEDGP
jgi:hypothetical protein